nr:hypothetical protein [Tanacetum cinerariifolium]
AKKRLEDDDVDIPDFVEQVSEEGFV